MIGLITVMLIIIKCNYMKKFIITESQERLIKEFLDKKFGIPLKNSLLKYKEALAKDHYEEYPFWLENYGREYYDDFTEEDIEEVVDAFYDSTEEEQYNDALVDDGFTNYLYDKYILKRRYYWEDEYDNDDFDDSNEYEGEYNWGDEIYPIMKYKGDLRNHWLLNYTNNADYIANNGFTVANTKISQLPCTTDALHLAKVGDEGYNFAYDAESFDTYVKDIFSYGGFPTTNAVLFQASGIEVYHNGDNENQVIFHNKDAKNIIPIYRENGYWCVKSRLNGKIIHKENFVENKNKKFDYGNHYFKTIERGKRNISPSDDYSFNNLAALNNLVNWVINNFPQYRKHLVRR